VLVKDSLNCAIDTSNALPLIKNMMYNKNSSNQYIMEKGTDANEMTFKSKNGDIKSHLDLTKIYQCSLWHNIIPFAVNPRSNS